ncbi:hypothetical protein AtDm6_1113 [Acetobacter tropicalis]|uniref:Uncharacterized protein n=2 Tax=Acetobacter tropicalis TaxID=104102 RepID=F7VB37_9PROT|nr:hypothetical protein AtDm6_1113 [Acetobacter tropicalis]GAA07582.1 hypothetical protein ATPR_0585 [Acetobacter tropicalis NBRC 101654]
MPLHSTPVKPCVEKEVIIFHAEETDSSLWRIDLRRDKPE